MSIKKKLAVVAAAGTAVLMLASSVAAELKVTPYGAAHYRLRFQHNMQENEAAGESFGTLDYTNRLCWRTGLRVSHDDVLSLHFQIGNDWGAAENVNWNANHSPFGRAGTANLYAHIASAKWNPGYMFIEAGILSVNSHGTLDLLAHSLGTGSYFNTGFNGWSDMNTSIIGLKLGAPIMKDDIKIGVELLQSIIDNRTQTLDSAVTVTPKDNPPSILTVLTMPINAGDFKITPEITAVWNRNYNRGIEAGDHELIGGLAGSYKVNDKVSINFNGGYGVVNNENSKAGGYSTLFLNSTTNNTAWRANTTAEVADTITPYYSSGMLIGAGATFRKLGPGDLQLGLNYTNSVNNASEETTNRTNADQIYTDIRYIIKLHDRFTFTPRYRTYTTMFAENHLSKFRLENRLELILEGSF